MKLRKTLAASIASLALAFGAVAPAWATGTMTVYGTDQPASSYWFHQNGLDCEEASAELVIRLTGHGYYNQQTVENWAQGAGIYVPGKGSLWSGEPTILKHYGVPNVSEGSHSITTVENYLASGQYVIAAVDGEEIWNKYFGWTVQADPGVQDHAVLVAQVVTNTDTSDDWNNYVLLIDTGNPQGSYERVPLSTFKDAWSKSGYQVTVAG